MKKLKIALAVVGGLVVVFVAVGFLLPSSWKVERSVMVNAGPQHIFPMLDNLKRWQEWTAWTDAMDPTMKRSFEGPEAGVGAVSHWSGEKMGSGTMKLTASDPAKGIAYDLAFEDYPPSHGAIQMAPAEGGTRVTWSDGADMGRNLIGRYFALAMDGMMGPDFEKGLSQLKARAEAEAAKPPPPAPEAGAPPAQ